MPFTFKALRLKYEEQIDFDQTLKPASKIYRKFCSAFLLKTWRGIDDLSAHRITEDPCREEWAKLFLSGTWRKSRKPGDEQFFNNTLGSLRAILDLAKLKRNPAKAVKRMGVLPTELKLPESQISPQIARRTKNLPSHRTVDASRAAFRKMLSTANLWRCAAGKK